MTPLSLGFIFDVPRVLSFSLKRWLPEVAPGLCLFAGNAIRWWNRKVERLGPMWALFAANCISTPQATSEVRSRIQIDTFYLMYNENPRAKTWAFV
jgi:hypothetical protein